MWYRHAAFPLARRGPSTHDAARLGKIAAAARDFKRIINCKSLIAIVVLEATRRREAGSGAPRDIRKKSRECREPCTPSRVNGWMDSHGGWGCQQPNAISIVPPSACAWRAARPI